MDIISNKWSKSTIFILPLLYPDIKFTDVIQEDFINCYISDITRPELEDSLIIEYLNDTAIFRIPKEDLSDYRLILQSKYSKISDKSKQEIISFWNERENSYLYSVLYKTNKILEYWKGKSTKEVHESSSKEYFPKFNAQEETRGLSSLYNKFTSYK